jgi:hypothetical protein
LNAELTIFGRAYVGEDSEVTQSGQSQEWQRKQDADHSQSEHGQPEESHGHDLPGTLRGVCRKMFRQSLGRWIGSFSSAARWVTRVRRKAGMRLLICDSV